MPLCSGSFLSYRLEVCSMQPLILAQGDTSFALSGSTGHREVSTGKEGPHRLGPLSQAFVFIVWVVGEGPSRAQLDSSQQLHAPSKHSLSWCVRATRFESVD